MRRADYWFLIILAVLLAVSLTGCSRKAPVEQAFNGVNDKITAVEHALPAECRTEDVDMKLALMRHEINQAQITCETEIQEYKTKYKMTLSAFSGLILLILAYFFVKR